MLYSDQCLKISTKKSPMTSSFASWKKASVHWKENPVLKTIEKFTSFLLLILVAAYRTLGTLFMGGACRFEPSCSEYAVEALQKHNPFFATKIIFLRILKCRPGGPHGFDPVPEHLNCSHCEVK